MQGTLGLRPDPSRQGSRRSPNLRTHRQSECHWAMASAIRWTHRSTNGFDVRELEHEVKNTTWASYAKFPGCTRRNDGNGCEHDSPVCAGRRCLGELCLSMDGAEALTSRSNDDGVRLGDAALSRRRQTIRPEESASRMNREPATHRTPASRVTVPR